MSTTPVGPWTKYAQAAQQQSTGPWTKYAPPATSTPEQSPEDKQALETLKTLKVPYPGTQDWAKDLSPSQYLAMQQKGSSLELPAQMLGSMAVSGPLAALKVAKDSPWLMKLMGMFGRSATAGAGMAAGEAVAGGKPQDIKTAGVTGAVSQPIAEGVSTAASNLAPNVAESALRVTDKMRGRGRTIGDAVLEHTTGVSASSLEDSAKQAIEGLMPKMEAGIQRATDSGTVGTAQPAKDVLNDAIDKLPRNAKTIEAKLASIKDLFDLGRGTQATYTPNELLEMKRGIGFEIGSWPAEFQHSPPIKALKQRLYGALDGELDRIVPGNSDFNQIISSLIPAKDQAEKIGSGASIAQLMAHRMAAHTGAALTGVAGSVAGYKEGGTPGAIAGGIAGTALPEMMTSTTGQMVLARFLKALGDKATSPQFLPLVKALAANAKQ